MQKSLIPRGLALVLLLVSVIAATRVQAGETSNPAQPVLSKTLRHVSFAGGDGSICEKAVVIRNAANQFEGVTAEKAWMAWKYPSAKIKGQAVSGHKNKTFESFELEATTGESKPVCFDITGFFGQW